MSAEVSSHGSEITSVATPGEGQQRVARNAGIYLIYQLISWAVAFVSVSIIPRAIGENVTGQIAFTGSALNLVGTLYGMGIESYLVAEIGRDPSKAESLFRATFGLRLIITLPFNILAWCLLFALHASPLILYMCIFGSLAGYIGSFTGAMRAVFAGWEQAKRVVILDLISISTALFAIPFLHYGPQVIAYPGLVLCIISGTLRVYWLRGKINLRPSFDKKVIFSLMRGGLPFIVNDFLAQISLFVTLAILHTMINDDAVGVYTQATKLLGTFMFVSTVIGAALLPAISRLADQDPERFRATQTRVFGILVIAGLPVMAGAIVLAEPLCHLLYGTHRFVGMTPVLQCCALTVIPLYIVSTMYQFLVAQRKNMQWTGYMIATYVIAALACLIFVPFALRVWHNGAIGAALAIAFSETCGAIFAFYLLGTNPFSQGMGWRIVRAMFATALMAGVMWLTRGLFIVIPAALGTLVFVTAVWLLRALPPEEQTLIVNTFLKKLRRFQPRQAQLEQR